LSFELSGLRAANAIPEIDLTLDGVYRADEMFCTGTMGERAGVTKVDDRLVDNGTIGPMTKQLSDIYAQRTTAEGVQVVNPGDLNNCRRAKRRSVIIEATLLGCASGRSWIQFTEMLLFACETFRLPKIHEAVSSNSQLILFFSQSHSDFIQIPNMHGQKLAAFPAMKCFQYFADDKGARARACKRRRNCLAS
jgi:hypothetical protein